MVAWLPHASKGHSEIAVEGGVGRARQATRKLISPYWHRLLLTSSLRHIAADVEQVSKPEFGHSVSSK